MYTLLYSAQRCIGRELIASAVSSRVYLGQDSSPICPLVTPRSSTSNGIAKINKFVLLIEQFLVFINMYNYIHQHQVKMLKNWLISSALVKTLKKYFESIYNVTVLEH